MQDDQEFVTTKKQTVIHVDSTLEVIECLTDILRSDVLSETSTETLVHKKLIKYLRKL